MIVYWPQAATQDLRVHLQTCAPEIGLVAESELGGVGEGLRKVGSEKIQAHEAAQEGAVVPGEVTNFAGVEVDVAAGQVLLGAAAPVVDDPRVRQIDDAPARARHPAAEVKLLAEHEVASIEAASLGESLAPAQQRGTTQPPHVLGFTIGLIVHI